MSVWISQFILEDVGILDPIDDKSITWLDLNFLKRRWDPKHSPQNFSSQSVQYFMALEFLPSSVHGSQKLGVAMVNLYKKKESDNVS
jgi:hypothetical protein